MLRKNNKILYPTPYTNARLGYGYFRANPQRQTAFVYFKGYSYEVLDFKRQCFGSDIIIAMNREKHFNKITNKEIEYVSYRFTTPSKKVNYRCLHKPIKDVCASATAGDVLLLLRDRRRKTNPRELAFSYKCFTQTDVECIQALLSKHGLAAHLDIESIHNVQLDYTTTTFVLKLKDSAYTLDTFVHNTLESLNVLTEDTRKIFSFYPS